MRRSTTVALGERGYTGSSEEIEEERGPLYVAMTRARRTDAGRPRRFYAHGQPRDGDRNVFAGGTRFIPPTSLKHFELFACPPPQAQSVPVARDVPAVDLAARMRAPANSEKNRRGRTVLLDDCCAVRAIHSSYQLVRLSSSEPL
jgi:hypothetical protein